MKIRYQLQNTTCDKKNFHPPLVLWRSIEKTTRGQSWNGASFVTFQSFFQSASLCRAKKTWSTARNTCSVPQIPVSFRPKQKHFPRLFQSLSLNSPPSFTYMSNLICKSYSLEIAAWITVVLFPSLHLLFIFNLKANILKHTHASL